MNTQTFEDLFGPVVDIWCTRVSDDENAIALVVEGSCGCTIMRGKDEPQWRLKRGQCALPHPELLTLRLTEDQMERAADALMAYSERPEEWFPS
ncbi:MAG TPA: hypothetical protein VNJ51_07490 [Candidatus Dormibacteraeota bacterium]|nr:hypothetical protein [Candidatus Dormibacteraeota bacterium]